MSGVLVALALKVRDFFLEVINNILLAILKNLAQKVSRAIFLSPKEGDCKKLHELLRFFWHCYREGKR